jgi:NADH dehydrogenase
MATIGRSRAVAMMDRLHLTGFLAWLAWLLVHIWYLIGFKNRVVVLIIWAWSYFTYRRGARIITRHTAPDASRLLAATKPAAPTQEFKATGGARSLPSGTVVRYDAATYSAPRSDRRTT